VDEQARSVVRKSSGRCTTGACGQKTVRRVVVGWTRLQRDGVGSGAACHELVCDNHIHLRCAIHPRDMPPVRACPLPIDLLGIDDGPHSSATPPLLVALSQPCPLGNPFTPHQRVTAVPRAAGQDARASRLAPRPARRRPLYRTPRLPGHALRLRPRPRPRARAGRSPQPHA
jgi:hypothetical protein